MRGLANVLGVNDPWYEALRGGLDGSCHGQGSRVSYRPLDKTTDWHFTTAVIQCEKVTLYTRLTQ